MSDPISELLASRRAAEAAKREASAQAAQAAKDEALIVRQVSLEAEALCRRFIAWANRRGAKPTWKHRSERGWIIANAVSWSGSDDRNASRSVVVLTTRGSTVQYSSYNNGRRTEYSNPRQPVLGQHMKEITETIANIVYEYDPAGESW